VGELGFHYIVVERALLVSRVDAVERKRARSGRRRGQYRNPWSAALCSSVLSDIGTPSSLDVQQIADQRRAISAFSVGLAPSATESTPEVVQHEVSVSLGIVGHNGWGTHDKTLAGIRVRAGFDSGRGDCGDRKGMGACLLPGSLLFYFCH
jgi:hypothetical protein